MAGRSGRSYGELRRRWDEKAIRAALRMFADASGQVPISRVMKENRALYDICRYHYGSLARAARAVGLYAQSQLRQWDKESVLDSIRTRQAAGLSMRSVDVRHDDIPLYGAACKRFRGWGAAVAAAGGGQSPMSDKELVTAVCAHRAGPGGPLPYGLATTIRRRHGTVEAFYQTYGLSHQWTSERIIAELRKYPTPPPAGAVRDARPGFYFRTLRRFGNWPNALAAAFPPQSTSMLGPPTEAPRTRSASPDGSTPPSSAAE